MMRPAIFEQRKDVYRRLMELGVAPEPLSRSIKAGQLARLSCSDNDPPFIPGTEAWRYVVRTLREELLQLGWRKDDPGNYSLVINDSRKINIVVATGDSMTCVASRSPRTKSLKGLYTHGAVVRNIYQGDLFPETIADDLKRIANLLSYPVWILLVHITETECRGELSLPRSIEGNSIEWAERIFIPREEGDEDAIQLDDDQGSDFEVFVQRKA